MSSTGRMFEATNGMTLDMFAALARKDYEDQQALEITKAKKEERDRSWPEDKAERCLAEDAQGWPK